MHSVLVTGGAGFIGSHVVDLLLTKGYRVRVYDKLVEQVHQNSGGQYVSEGAELIVGDMCDRRALADALEGIDAVINLAAEVGVGQSMYEITRYVNANTGGTATLLELLAEGKHQVKRMVVASSMSVYGEGQYTCTVHGHIAPLPRSTEQLKHHQWELACPRCGAQLTPVATSEDKPVNPTSIYAISKLDQELMSLSIGQAYGIGTVALRLFNVYGTRQALSNPYTGIGAIFSSRLLNGQPPLIFEDGNQIRDLVHVSDVANAIVKAMEATEVTNAVCNIGSGQTLTVKEIALLLAKELEVDIKPTITNDYRTGDIRHCWADTTRAAELLGFEAKVTFDAGVKELIGWVKHHTAVDNALKARSELTSRDLTL